MSKQMSGTGRFRLGVDVGGTFTDFVLMDCRTGQTHVGKVLTTPADPSVGVLSGIGQLLEEHGGTPKDLGQLVHATTLVANALIERNGAVVGLITTEGFRDNLEIGREMRYDTYDLFLERPPHLVPRHLRRGVRERILADGTVYLPLDTDHARRTISDLVAGGVQSIAICLMHSPRNPSHESAIGELLAVEFPSVDVTLSSAIAPEIREYERTVTTAANAYVRPVVRRYLDRLRTECAQRGFEGAISLMLSSGAITRLETARDVPVRLVESGPAAGALAAGRYGQLAGWPDLISFDMGGTTAKVCLIHDGQPSQATEFEVARLKRFKRGSGLPLRISSVEMIEIGAGGGSIARLDQMGLLKVGPDSAGATPGPACYGLGGRAPTVTDADLLLGYLNPEYFLGGTMRLDTGAAEGAIKREIADPVGWTVLQAAQSVHAVVNENMAQAARIHVIERGADPRRFSLLAFGGAGPIHAYAIARILKLSRVIVPLAAGTTSALGLLLAPSAFDTSRTYVCRIKGADWPHVNRLYDEMTEQAVGDLIATGIAGDSIAIHRFADMRYVGQGHEITVPIPSKPLAPEDGSGIQEAFYAAYRNLFGREIRDVATEALVWRVRAVGPLPNIDLRKSATNSTDAQRVDEGGRAPGTRSVLFAEFREFIDCSVYNRYHLVPGDRLKGPAIVEERESTTVIGPSATAVVDDYLNIVMSLK